MGKIPFKKKVVLLNRPAFLDRLSVLLTEGYTFHEGITLLLPHHMKEYTTVLTNINNDFKEGLGVTQILSRFGFSSNVLLPVAIAELDGRLALALKGMAARLRKKEEKQKKLKSLLAYPIVLFVFITVLLVAYRRFFLPNMEALAFSRKESTNSFVSILPALVTKIPDIVIGMGILSALLTVVCVIIYKKIEPDTKIRVMTAIPVVGTFFLMLKTRDFASEIGGLLQSGLSMQNALDVLIDQQLDVVLSEIAKNVKRQVVFGESFHSASQMTEGLTNQLAAFAKHGAESGHLSKELLIYSEHLGEAIDDKLTKALAMLQPALFGIIAICILAAYLALLLPVYGMMNKL
ncbi:competence type IV pilus assembly protein ComGB [Sporosarcina sp. NPDC096371]|uniref:competence type IV pilus assembly protein ComGB n=1 Tax=Sporosarcina sp. NPDC096371 TaxID=3364530 RepID=UPI00380FCF85